ncbi:MAG: hypothetical protein C0408_06335 [Odoribacter sp.]|nr:hypothetical protein [Odoribacter sp.]
MRKLFLISVVVLSVNIQAASQNQFSVVCDDTWGPGRFNKVTFTITVPGSDGFARFSQDLPVGLEVANDNIGNGDFDMVNNQLNIVWMKLPENRIMKFSYFVKPDKNMNGSFIMTGKLITVSGESAHKTVLMKEKVISIEGTNGILPEQIGKRTEKKSANKTIKEPDSQFVAQEGEIIFRVQVSVSSTRFTEGELIKKLGLSQGTGVKIIPAGKMYKYQAGSFPSYDSANKLLKQIIARGYRDAFIVAYRGNEQIPVEKALNSLK